MISGVSHAVGMSVSILILHAKIITLTIKIQKFTFFERTGILLRSVRCKGWERWRVTEGLMAIGQTFGGRGHFMNQLRSQGLGQRLVG